LTVLLHHDHRFAIIFYRWADSGPGGCENNNFRNNHYLDADCTPPLHFPASALPRFLQASPVPTSHAASGFAFRPIHAPFLA
jgi:hypothetical protein